MARIEIEVEELLTVGQVARMFAVDPKTVSRWAKQGKLNCIRTIGQHRRFKKSEILALLQPSNS